VAVSVTLGRRLRLPNPLSLEGTALPPSLLLMAKLVFVVLLVKGYGTSAMPARRVAFFAFLERLGPEAWWRPALAGAFALGAVLVLANLRPRLGCLLGGLAQVLATLGDAGSYANSRLYPGCILVLLGLWDGRWGTFALRAQVFLLYLGAGLNKLLDPDWRDGRCFEFWMREIQGVEWYGTLADRLPAMALSTVMGLAVIAGEVAIVVALLRRRWWPAAFLVALVFHVGAFLLTGEDFGAFLYVSLLSFLAFAPPRTAAMQARGSAGGAAEGAGGPLQPLP